MENLIEKKIEQIFRKIDFKEYISGTFNSRYKIKKIISKIIEFENEKKRKLNIIDIGCGAGYISRAIAWLGHSVVGIDQNSSVIEYAYSITPRELNVEYYSIPAELVQEKFSPAEFDLLICSEVIEHLPDPFQLSWLPGYLLREGGMAIITVPNGYSLEERIRWFLSKTKIGNLIANFLSQRKIFQNKLHKLEEGSPHLYYFSFSQIKYFILSSKLRLESIEPTAGFFWDLYYLFFRFLIKGGGSVYQFLERLDQKLIRLLPLSFASGWLVVARKE